MNSLLLLPLLKNLPDLTLEGVEASLLEEDKKLKNDGTSSSYVEQALYNKSYSKVQCNHCGRMGHIVAQCRHRNKPKLLCNVCGKVGHLDNNC